MGANLSVMELLCVAEIDGRTATGAVPIDRELWGEADEETREVFRQKARAQFRRAAAVQLGVELSEGDVASLPVTAEGEPVQIRVLQ